MNTFVINQVVLWVWLVLAIAAVLAMGVGYWFQLKGTSDEWEPVALLQLGQQIAIALIFLALHTLRHPLVAVWSWRVLSSLFFAVTMFEAFRGSFLVARGNTLVLRLVRIGSTAVGGLLTLCSFFWFDAAAAPSPKVGSLFTWSMAQSVNVFVVGALVVLGLVTLASCLLWLNAMTRSRDLSFEFSDAGIGGGSTVWKMPASISYLVATVCFGGLFVALLLHEETRTMEPSSRPGVTNTAGAAPASSAAAQASPTAHEAVPATSPANANSSVAPPKPKD